MTTIKALLLLLLAVLFSSCVYNKDSYLSTFENFVEKVEKSEKLTEEDYTSIKKKYLDFSETYYTRYKSELTNEEKLTIVKLKTRYYKSLALHGIKNASKDLEDLSEKATEFINEILE